MLNRPKARSVVEGQRAVRSDWELKGMWLKELLLAVDLSWRPQSTPVKLCNGAGSEQRE